MRAKKGKAAEVQGKGLYSLLPPCYLLVDAESHLNRRITNSGGESKCSMAAARFPMREMRCSRASICSACLSSIITMLILSASLFASQAYPLSTHYRVQPFQNHPSHQTRRPLVADARDVTSSILVTGTRIARLESEREWHLSRAPNSERTRITVHQPASQGNPNKKRVDIGSRRDTHPYCVLINVNRHNSKN